MFSKPFNLLLIYILSIINLLILFLPIVLSVSPLFLVSEKQFVQGMIDISYLSFFIVSSFMILYLTLDCILGFTIWGLTRGAKPAVKYTQKFEFIPELIENFNDLQNKFGVRKVVLFIASSDEVNAYAIGSFRKKIVVLTMGLLVHIRDQCDSEEEFQTAIKAILAHEISHLVNKDFLPTLLLFANEKATSILLGIVHLFFKIILKIVKIVPIMGGVLYGVIAFIYRVTCFFINFFHRYIILKVFEFLKLHISRETEYRCDYQAALACGGDDTAFALSFLGKAGFITIFSTHPSTASRIRYVKNVKAKKGVVKVSLINKLSNFFSISILFVILVTSWNYVNKIEYLQIDNSKMDNRVYKINSFFNSHIDTIKKGVEKLF